MKAANTIQINASYEEALEKVSSALKEEGFGILSEIAVGDIFKNKLNLDFGGYKILGACLPPLAHKALEQDRDLGVLLPCNVVVYEKEGSVYAGFFNGDLLTAVHDTPKVQAVAKDMNERLQKVIQHLN